MRRIIILLFLLSGVLFAQTITVTSPNGGEEWPKGETRNITWTASGLTNTVKLVLYKNGELVGKIADGQSNSGGSFAWTVGDLHDGTKADCANDYTIKVREQGGVSFTTEDVSNAPFSISGCLTLFNPGVMHLLQDLEIRNVRYVYNRGGWIVASVKSNVNTFSGDVNFAVVFPEVSRGGLIRVTKNLNIARGRTRTVYLYQKMSAHFPPNGLLTKVYVDYGNSISESKEDNNEMEKRLTVYDLHFTESIRGSLVFERLYLQGGNDYKVKFSMKVKNTHTRRLRNVKVTCIIQEVGGSIIALRGLNDVFPAHIIERIGAGETYTKHFSFVFGKSGRRNAKYPRIKQGKRYSIVLQIDRDNDFAETNERNNRTSLTFGPVPR